MTRKTRDPALLALFEQRRKAEDAFYRWYARLRRAVTAMEKARRAVQRVSKRINEHQTKAPA